MSVAVIGLEKWVGAALAVGTTFVTAVVRPTVSPAFDADVRVYSAAVDEAADSVTVTAAANDGDTTVAFSLAEDGDTEDRLTQPRVFGRTGFPALQRRSGIIRSWCIRDSDDHRRPERVVMESTGSFVLITGPPQDSAGPDIIRDAKSPCFFGP